MLILTPFFFPIIGFAVWLSLFIIVRSRIFTIVWSFYISFFLLSFSVSLRSIDCTIPKRRFKLKSVSFAMKFFLFLNVPFFNAKNYARLFFFGWIVIVQRKTSWDLSMLVALFPMVFFLGRGNDKKKDFCYFQRFFSAKICFFCSGVCSFSLLSQKLLFYLLQFKADFGCCTTTKSTLSRVLAD